MNLPTAPQNDVFSESVKAGVYIMSLAPAEYFGGRLYKCFNEEASFAWIRVTK
jgi:hypothetical protein